MYYKRHNISELDNIHIDDTFIVICSIEPENELPVFSTIYKMREQKVIKYSIGLKREVSEFTYQEYRFDAEQLLETASYFMIRKGDIFEFIRLIETEEFENYFEDVANFDFDKIKIPKVYTKERVDKYLEFYTKNVFKYSYDKTVDKIKLAQYITWGISITSIILSVINMFFLK